MSNVSLRELELYRVVEPVRSCSYVDTEQASLEYRIFSSLTAWQFGELLRRGWRRHGRHLFRPACPHCNKCRSLRVAPDTFQPSKSQRRAEKKNAHIRVELHRATVTDEHIQLYNLWHTEREAARGWRGSQTSIDDYASGFLDGNWGFAHEMRYLDATADDRLIGVSLVDLVPQGLSSIYFYYDPAWRPLSPGVFSALKEIEFCRQHHLPHVYFGYWIQECPSMTYKNQFRPHQLLTRYPADDEEPDWQLVPSED